MSLRELVDADCGGQNALTQLGGQLTRDVTFQDEGLRHHHPGMVQDFLHQTQPLPQTFHLAEIMKEIQHIEERASANLARGVNGNDWAQELASSHGLMNDMPSTSQGGGLMMPVTRPLGLGMGFGASSSSSSQMQMQQPKVEWTKDFFDAEEKVGTDDIDEWVKAFEHGKDADEQAAGMYNREFWEKLQDEWKKLSEESEETRHSWLGDFSDIYDPYKEYKFEEDNPLIDVENPLEKGKAFLEQGDIPSAVLCFEAAVKQTDDNAEAWKLLGTTQAENENDPNAIPALKKALELAPDRLEILMSLAVCYTNESYQNQALKMLTQWLSRNPKYTHLVKNAATDVEAGAESTTVAPRYKLKEVQDLYLEAVMMNPEVVDADVQEALGVLFNLSQEYDKAVDCFQAAVSVNPNNARIWNRLGASLANGNRNIEAVEAYQNALELEPGFIRARYNVGIICINLKSYKEAAEHLLMALNHQASSGARAGIHSPKPMSDSIWNTLRMAVSLAGKHHLQKAIESRDLNALNEAFSSEN